jgi:hypothetical protein
LEQAQRGQELTTELPVTKPSAIEESDRLAREDALAQKKRKGENDRPELQLSLKGSVIVAAQ